MVKAPGQKYILDADIAKCFDTIDHQALLEKLQTFPAMKAQIKAWLTAGVMLGFSSANNDQGQPNRSGTPQGGVISPLLANIALHGLENYILKTVRTKDHTKISLIRYADDFVVLHRDLDVVRRCRAAAAFLKGLGLELSPTKTSLVRMSHGFNYLGFSIIRGRRGRKYKTLIHQKSKASVQCHGQDLRRIIQAHRNASAYVLIQKLRPVIISWCNY